MRQQLVWVLVATFLLAAAVVAVPEIGQAQRQSNFTNIQVLTDMSDGDIQRFMMSVAQQFGVTCVECHVQGDFASDDLPKKQIARNMMRMVNTLNETTFADTERKANCFMCHRGSFEIPEN